MHVFACANALLYVSFCACARMCVYVRAREHWGTSQLRCCRCAQHSTAAHSAMAGRPRHRTPWLSFPSEEELQPATCHPPCVSRIPLQRRCPLSMLPWQWRRRLLLLLLPIPLRGGLLPSQLIGSAGRARPIGAPCRWCWCTRWGSGCGRDDLCDAVQVTPDNRISHHADASGCVEPACRPRGERPGQARPIKHPHCLHAPCVEPSLRLAAGPSSKHRGPDGTWPPQTLRGISHPAVRWRAPGIGVLMCVPTYL